MMTAPLLAALALAIGISWLAVHEARDRADQRIVRATQGLSVATVALVAWCAWSVAAERKALVEADLAPGAVLEVPAQSSPPMVLVRGQLPHVETGESAAGSVELEVRSEAELVGRYSATLGETWRQGRAGRSGQTQSLIVDDEARFDLPESAEAHPLRITLASEEGELEGPVHVAVLSPPPPWTMVAGVGAALAAVAAAFDLRSGRKTRSGLWIALLAAFSVALLDGVTPHSSPMAIAGAGLLALMIGFPAWLVIKGLVGTLPLAPPVSPEPTAG